MKRPAFQFYPADWRKDNELQSCSIGARGLWHELLCVMHECKPYGYLTVNGNPATDVQAANLARCSLPEYRKLMAELDAAGVPGRTDDGVLYSRRMVKDQRLREVRADGGKLGAEHGAKGGKFGKLGGRPRKEQAGLSENVEGGKKPPLNPPPSSSSSSLTPVLRNGNEARANPPNGKHLKTVGANGPLENLPAQWWKSDEGIESAAKSFGIVGIPGQGHKELKARIFDQVAKHKRGAA